MSRDDRPGGGPPESNLLTTRHVRGAVEGEAESLAWIAARFSPALHAQARYRLRHLPLHLHDPEDLVQEVWLIALPKLAALVPREGHLTPVLLKFLSSILRQRSRTLAQKHLWGKPARAPHARGASDTCADPLRELSAQATGALSRAMRSEVGERMRTTIDDLPESDREILVLRGIEQNPNHTVAMLLGLPPGTVAVRYHRALQRLRQRLPGSIFDELE